MKRNKKKEQNFDLKNKHKIECIKIKVLFMFLVITISMSSLLKKRHRKINNKISIVLNRREMFFFFLNLFLLKL